jgi:4-amino-4-deoxy-L-arabinose transferase-like glycosyltransferase
MSHLGHPVLISDEAIRGTVALEMINSGNFINPTMYGELYFKKPPLFNWIVIGFFELFDSQSEFVLRLPTILALLLFSITSFLFIRRQLGSKVAWFTTLAVLSCGRILFYDSMLALIDVWFSWIIFSNFMLIFLFYQKRQFWALFLLSYALTAVAFMFKGLPALAFQAITLLAVFIAGKQFRRLLSLQHICGIILFFGLLALYYLTYLKNLPGKEDLLLSTIFSESAKRTAVQYGWWKTVLHLFTFPAEVLFHFAPWTLFALVLFRRGVIKKIREHTFLSYAALIVLANITVYWVSVEVYPRYLFMFLPLIFAIPFYFVFQMDASSRFRRIADMLILGLAIITALGFAFLPQSGLIKHVECLASKSMFFAFLSALLVLMMVIYRKTRLMGLVILLFILRLGYNFILQEEKIATARTTEVRTKAIAMGKFIHSRDAAIFGTTPLDYISGFYVTREYGKTLRRQKEGYTYHTYYIIDPSRLEKKPHSLYFNYVQWWESRNIMLIKLKK